MESLEEKSKRLDDLIEQAEKLRDTENLRSAIKAYRKALPLARSPEQKDEIQSQIDDLHDMLVFVESEAEKKRPLHEQGLDLLRDNPIPVMVAIMMVVVGLLLTLVFPSVMASLSRRQQIEAPPPPKETVQPDKILEGDTSETIQDLKGTRKDSGIDIEESDSVVTLTIPAEFMDPYPLKYVQQEGAQAYQAIPAAEDAPADAEFALNEAVFLIGRSEDQNWLHIKRQSELKQDNALWMRPQNLGDHRQLTAEEIDARIKSHLGGQYWQIQAEGSEAPFSFFLYINAPNAQAAYQAMVAGYERYASKQLLTLLNTYSHNKVKRIEVHHSTPAHLAQNPKRFEVVFDLYQYNAQDYRKRLGTSRFEIEKSQKSKTGRYVMRELLEGF